VVVGAAMVAVDAAGAAGAAMVAAGSAASMVAVGLGLLPAEVAVASAVAVASVVAVAAAAGSASASGSMTTSGPVAGGTVAAAHPGERAACAKSHDLTAGHTKHSAKLRSASRWLRVEGPLRGRF
jgi:hypothetical protein